MSVDQTTEIFAKFSHKNSLNPKEMDMFCFSLREGSPLSDARAEKSKVIRRERVL